MPRPQRKEINFTKDSILSLMQEIYNELVEQRQTAIRIQNKMLTMLKDPEDMTTIGPVIEKQQKIVNDCVEKKISLSKLQSGIWEKSNNNTEEHISLKIEEIVSDSSLQERLIYTKIIDVEEAELESFLNNQPTILNNGEISVSLSEGFDSLANLMNNANSKLYYILMINFLKIFYTYIYIVAYIAKLC